MTINVTIVCEKLIEEQACNLIMSATPNEIIRRTENEFHISTNVLSRAGDLLHAIRSVLGRARNEKP